MKRTTVKTSANRPQRSASLGPASAAGAKEALELLTAETISLFHRLKLAIQEVHGLSEAAAGRRGVMRGLYRLGPQTVPQMARVRPVSRQHIQVLVDGLAADGLVEFLDNPAHKRSRLVALTQAGKQLVELMDRREALVMSQLVIPLQEKKLRSATRVLRTVNELFQSKEWKQALKRLHSS